MSPDRTSVLILYIT